jgi:hypothetical protein
VALSSEFRSGWKTVFMVNKSLYLYLLILILLYQPQDLQPGHPVTTKHKYNTFCNTLQESLYFCVQISYFQAENHGSYYYFLLTLLQSPWCRKFKDLNSSRPNLYTEHDNFFQVLVSTIVKIQTVQHRSKFNLCSNF